MHRNNFSRKYGKTLFQKAAPPWQDDDAGRLRDPPFHPPPLRASEDGGGRREERPLEVLLRPHPPGSTSRLGRQEEALEGNVSVIGILQS